MSYYSDILEKQLYIKKNYSESYREFDIFKTIV